MQTLSNYQKVFEFNTAFGHPANTELYTDIFSDDPKLVQLRLDLIDEESQEFVSACENHDLVEVADGLGDILVVTYGMGVVFGIDLDDAMNDIYFKDSPSDKSNYQRVCSIKRSNSYPMYSTVQHNIFNENPTMVKYHMDAIRDEFNALVEATKSQDMDSIKTKLVRLLVETYYAGGSFGMDLDEAMGLIHDSNMSKICSTEDEAKQTVMWYHNEFKKGRQPYDSATYRPSPCGKKWVVFNESTGKILKNINYQVVNLKPFINKTT